MYQASFDLRLSHRTKALGWEMGFMGRRGGDRLVGMLTLEMLIVVDNAMRINSH